MRSTATPLLFLTACLLSQAEQQKDHHRHGPTTVKYFGQSQLASITFDAVERRTDPPFHHATSPILAHDLPEKDLRGRSQKVATLFESPLSRRGAGKKFKESDSPSRKRGSEHIRRTAVKRPLPPFVEKKGKKRRKNVKASGDPSAHGVAAHSPLRLSPPRASSTHDNEFQSAPGPPLSSWITGEKRNKDLLKKGKKRTKPNIKQKKAVKEQNHKWKDYEPKSVVFSDSNNFFSPVQYDDEELEEELGKHNKKGGLSYSKHPPETQSSARTRATTTPLHFVTTPLSINSSRDKNSAEEYIATLGENIEREVTDVLAQRDEQVPPLPLLPNVLAYVVRNGVIFDRFGRVVKRVDDPLKPPGSEDDDIDVRNKEAATVGFKAKKVKKKKRLRASSKAAFTNVLPALLNDEPEFRIAPSEFGRNSFGRQKKAHGRVENEEESNTLTTKIQEFTVMDMLTMPRPPKLSPPPFPFVNCYMNLDGFMCCNRTLEILMRRSFDATGCLQEEWQHTEGCGVQRIAGVIQEDAERHFKTTFEVIASLGDFAMKSHFSADLTCKIEVSGKYLAAYATATSPPGMTAKPDSENLLSIITDMTIPTRGSSRAPPPPAAPPIALSRLLTTAASPPLPAAFPLALSSPDLIPTSTQSSLAFASSTNTPQLPIMPALVFSDDEFQIDSPSIVIAKPDEATDSPMSLALEMAMPREFSPAVTVIPMHERSRDMGMIDVTRGFIPMPFEEERLLQETNDVVK